MARRIVLVAAVAENGVIGNGPDIPWRIPGEQAWFKEFTMGNTLVMGRKTFESIGRALPGRTTIVVTRDLDWRPQSEEDGAKVLVAHSIERALAYATETQGDVMVVGGAQIYEAAMPYASEQVVTRVHLEPEGDVLYPTFDPDEWLVTASDPHEMYDRIFYSRR